MEELQVHLDDLRNTVKDLQQQADVSRYYIRWIVHVFTPRQKAEGYCYEQFPPSVPLLTFHFLHTTGRIS